MYVHVCFLPHPIFPRCIRILTKFLHIQFLSGHYKTRIRPLVHKTIIDILLYSTTHYIYGQLSRLSITCLVSSTCQVPAKYLLSVLESENIGQYNYKNISFADIIIIRREVYARDFNRTKIFRRYFQIPWRIRDQISIGGSCLGPENINV